MKSLGDTSELHLSHPKDPSQLHQLERGNDLNGGDSKVLNEGSQGSILVAAEVNPEVSSDFDVYGNEEHADSKSRPPSK